MVITLSFNFSKESVLKVYFVEIWKRYTVKQRYEALHYDTITDMKRWSRGPRGIFQGVQYLKFSSQNVKKIIYVTICSRFGL